MSVKITTSGVLLNRLNKCRPFFCYALARKPDRSLRGRHKRYTLAEISERSGIPERTCYRLANKLSWRGVDIELGSAFFYGCGVNPFQLQVQKNYVKKTSQVKHKFAHLLPSQLKSLENKLARLELLLVENPEY